ncbi:Murein transglycosylase [Desulfonema limicola]|uniref:Murein transglycosylase n=1 Tax=Desulfonema limicola TaxID=45656 RepID=A0A975GHW4_9BACT|nr:murein transglycosylase domain-containing protein [Desulfonema limicola]QTA81882.1 Murein transglycosylase [Desulfonema limicola]
MKIIAYFRTFILFSCIIIFLFPGCSVFNIREKPDKTSFKEKIEKKWDTVKLSDVSSWVDYSPTLDTRSEINFAKGNVIIETVVPELSRDLKEQGEKQIADQMKKVFLSGVSLGKLVLKDQLKNQDGEIVTPDNLDTYIIKEILPKIKIENTSYTSKDSIKRVKAYSQVSLVPDHVRVRSMQYYDIILKYSKKYKLAPQLMLALIHKESFFNPFAKSFGGALGLMQLMPEYGAREAYNFLFKKDMILPENYFYDPENNIELGTAYFHILKTRYFNKIKSRVKNEYLSICAYNWGPTRVNRLISQHNINEMNNLQLYTMLRNNTPEETRDYLEKIYILSEQYKKMI